MEYHTNSYEFVKSTFGVAESLGTCQIGPASDVFSNGNKPGALGLGCYLFDVLGLPSLAKAKEYACVVFQSPL